MIVLTGGSSQKENTMENETNETYAEQAIKVMRFSATEHTKYLMAMVGQVEDLMTKVYLKPNKFTGEDLYKLQLCIETLNEIKKA